MLKELHIQNYAIIDELVIRFDSALNIITGETGAGKSILMGALSLILGERADPNVVLNKDRKCFVEGVFEVPGNRTIEVLLSAHDLEAGDEILIRREISNQGKSRAFINDTPVTLNVLQKICVQLVDIHQQFDTLTLGESGFQLAVIDAMAGNELLLVQYKQAYRQWSQVHKSLDQLKEQKTRDNRELDYNQYLFNELEEAGFRTNELEEIETELQLLADAEGIKLALNRVDLQLNASELPIVQLLRQLVQQLQPYSRHHTRVAELIGRLQGTAIELDDIASEASRLSEQISHDASRITNLNERFDAGNKMLKKHNVHTTAELLEIQEELSKKMQVVAQLDDQIAQFEKDLITATTSLNELATSLHLNRLKQVSPFEKQVNALLARVGMPNAKIRVQLESAYPNLSGADTIDFLFDANKSNQFASIRKVASGGELSRLMLSIKSLVAGKMDLPTLIFDEIDSGISGEASRQVGLIMKELASARQVICITHQPQIAGKADRHFYVYKQMMGDTLSTFIKTLGQEERIDAIAKMLGGEKPTAAAIEHAREMVMN